VVELAECLARTLGVVTTLQTVSGLAKLSAPAGDLRLGLFICADFLVRAAAEARGSGPAQVSVELRPAAHAADGIEVRFRAMGCQLQVMAEGATWPGSLARAAEILAPHGGRIGWRAAGAGEQYLVVQLRTSGA